MIPPGSAEVARAPDQAELKRATCHGVLVLNTPFYTYRRLNQV